jgi:ATP-dependent helicase/nuclease subunit A
LDSEKYQSAREIDLAKRNGEYWRLLYVAMTRARDRLFIFGCDDGSENENWHSKLYEIVKNMPGALISDNGAITISSGEKMPESMPEKVAKNIETHTLAFQNKSLIKHNSNQNGEKIAISEFIRGAGKKFAMRRGADIHRQLQFLDLSSDSELAAQIRANPEIARFWAAGSRAEVPIAGTIGGRFHSFRIDRMIETPDSVEFIDFKTDLTQGRRPEYAAKLKQYAALLSRIFPDKAIRANILWMHDWALDKIAAP